MLPLLAAAALLALTPLQAPSVRPVPPDGGALPPGLLLRYADQGLELGISNLVATWPDAQGSGLDLTQHNGRHKPRRAPFAADGRPALHFDGNDYLVAGD